MSTVYPMSKVSTVSTIYSAVLPPSLMLFFRYESSYNVSLHFAGFVHKRGGKEKYTPFFYEYPYPSWATWSLLAFSSSGLLGFMRFIILMSFMDELNAALLSKLWPQLMLWPGRDSQHLQFLQYLIDVIFGWESWCIRFNILGILTLFEGIQCDQRLIVLSWIKCM